MKYFVFSCHLRPTEKNPQKDVIGARSHTWIKCESIERARVRVFDYFLDSEWRIESIEHEIESQVELHPAFQNSERADLTPETRNSMIQSLAKLEKFGIGCEIFAYREESKT